MVAVAESDLPRMTRMLAGSRQWAVVSGETGAAPHVVLAGGVPDDDQGSPVELIGPHPLPSVDSHLETSLMTDRAM